MPKRIAPLSDTQIRNAIPGEKEYKLYDGGGLYVLITPSGGKLWRFKYRFNGKEKLLSFGDYKDVPLESKNDPKTGKRIVGAREKRQNARELLKSGFDPGQVQKEKKAETIASQTTFEMVAREWHTKQIGGWSKRHAETVLRRLEYDIFGAIGSRPIAEITSKELLGVLQKIEARGALETASRNKFVCGQIFRYGVATGQAPIDITAALRGALTPRVVQHHPAIIKPEQVAHLLIAIDSYNGTFIVKSALRLAPLVFIRPGELREAEWSEFDLNNAEWNIPPDRLKLTKQVKEYRTLMGDSHLVPLSRQALDILIKLKALTGSGRFLFPGRTTSRTMSNNSINSALRYMGFDKDTMCGHGFRAMARTILDQDLVQRVDLIEHQLGHLVKDANGRAYNRTSFLPERREMMQLWADYLEALKSTVR